MKFLLLLCLLPAVLCAPYAAEKKRFIEALHIDLTDIFQLNSLKCDIQLMLDQLGADPTEASCEAECHTLIAEGHYFQNGCPLVCHAFQKLVHLWHVVPDDGTPANSKCHTAPATTTAAPATA